VTDLQGLFKLSTSAVDNFVENSPLTASKPMFHAAFNKLPKREATKKTFKINRLKITYKPGEIHLKTFMLAFFVHKWFGTAHVLAGNFCRNAIETSAACKHFLWRKNRLHCNLQCR
jgi:hypothetical protein